MRSPIIYTEPQFSPDGKWLLFTSDRGGSPQIYRVPVDGGEAQRVTFNGGYNISPQVSPNGQNLAYVTRRNGAFRIAILDLNSEQEQLITNGPDDQSPSFAPKDRKSTRLNSSHVDISYAVFCLKKKKTMLTPM